MITKVTLHYGSFVRGNHLTQRASNADHWWTLCFALNRIFSQIVEFLMIRNALTHWGRVLHICVGNLTIIGPDNGLSPRRRQAIIWTNARILLIGPYGTSFSEILIGIHTFSFKKIPLKMSSAKWRPFFLGLNVLKVMWHHCNRILEMKSTAHFWRGVSIDAIKHYTAG